MCRKVTCKTCQLATWAGCGAHIEQVLGGIPESQRCQGHANTKTTKLATDAANANGFFAKIRQLLNR